MSGYILDFGSLLSKKSYRTAALTKKIKMKFLIYKHLHFSRHIQYMYSRGSINDGPFSVYATSDCTVNFKQTQNYNTFMKAFDLIFTRLKTFTHHCFSFYKF